MLTISSQELKHVSPLVKFPFLLRIYVFPWIFLYPLAYYAFYVEYDTYIVSIEWSFLLAIALFGGHSLSFLFTKWSLLYKSYTEYYHTTTLSSATDVLVTPLAHRGTGEVVPLSTTPTETFFYYQKDKYVYNPKSVSFDKIKYPCDMSPSLSLFQSAQGVSDADIPQLTSNYGKNTFDIPIPTFLDLFAEHAVAPFFVFQVFCAGLWCLDEYWYYSLFSLFMLVVFECTTVFQRLRTLAEFRTMNIKPFALRVWRGGRWLEIQSDGLFPGDLVAVSRTADDSGLPCDLLLLSGSCIVNEAMLSGESTPLLKESIALRDGNDVLDVNGADRNAVLFGGTKVLQARAGTADAAGAAPPPPDDNTCVCYVLRTGFGTSQGELVRTMIFSSETVSANNLESFLFIAFLLVFALAASAYVWIKGLEREDMNKSKLLLDCVIIITSVVPPELPMELTMAVNASLVALSKHFIYCTEPFRIPFAGRVDICCFDKTGTLTGEDLVVEGVSFGGALQAPDATTQETKLTLATAHALVLLDDGTLVGDPMEKTTLDSLGWAVGEGDMIIPAAAKAAAEAAAKAKEQAAKAKGKAKAGAKAGKPVAGKSDAAAAEAAAAAAALAAATAAGASPTAPTSIHIRRRFQFSSALKRMSTLSRITFPHTTTDWISVKGAPETLKSMYVSVPSDYDATYKAYAQRGSRVLALGYRALESKLSAQQVNTLSRDAVERDLHFGGFLVFHCPLKADAVAAIHELNDSSHRCVMITGDNPLTAVQVARAVEIVYKPSLILDVNDAGLLYWRSPDEKTVIELAIGGGDTPAPAAITPATVFGTPDTFGAQIAAHDLCVTGPALALIAPDAPTFHVLLQTTWVYARVSPAQKELILSTLKALGYVTLMAGDGTNDVGALKQANIGVALLNGSEEDMQAIAQHAQRERVKKVYEQQLRITARFKQPPPPVPALIADLFPDAVAAQQAVAADAVAQRAAGRPTGFDISTITDQLAATEGEEEVPQIKLGDASCAAPFTSKLANVNAIVAIIRQGRCTLVATIQMYKILALNCLISAYALSVQYLQGIKFGDYQVTITGILMSVCFMCISRARPVDTLSRERPLSSIFNAYVVFSILAQFAVHVGAYIYLTDLCEQYEPRAGMLIDLDAKFAPNLLNSVIYLISLSQQVSTFAINFQGRPFREGITENSALYYGLLGVSGVAICGATDFMPEFNRWLQLVDMSAGFRARLCAAMVLDYGLAWVFEIVLKWLFADDQPKEIVVRDADARAAARAVSVEQKTGEEVVEKVEEVSEVKA